MVSMPVRALIFKQRAESKEADMMLHSITATYPDFKSLPKGVKQMLLVSESVFFEEARTVRLAKPAGQTPVRAEAIHLARAGSQYESVARPPRSPGNIQHSDDE